MNLPISKNVKNIEQLYEKHRILKFPKFTDADLQIDMALLDGSIAGCVQTNISQKSLSRSKLSMLKNCLTDLKNKFTILQNEDQKKYFKSLYELGNSIVSLKK